MSDAINNEDLISLSDFLNVCGPYVIEKKVIEDLRQQSVAIFHKQEEQETVRKLSSDDVIKEADSDTYYIPKKDYDKIVSCVENFDPFSYWLGKERDINLILANRPLSVPHAACVYVGVSYDLIVELNERSILYKNCNHSPPVCLNEEIKKYFKFFSNNINNNPYGAFKHSNSRNDYMEILLTNNLYINSFVKKYIFMQLSPMIYDDKKTNEIEKSYPELYRHLKGFVHQEEIGHLKLAAIYDADSQSYSKMLVYAISAFMHFHENKKVPKRNDIIEYLKSKNTGLTSPAMENIATVVLPTESKSGGRPRGKE